MKLLHIGQLIGGLDVYIRNSIEYASGDIEYVIIHGEKDGSKPISCKGKPVKEYLTALQRNLNPIKDFKTIVQAVKIIKKERPDVIHCHSAKGGIVGRIAGWITGTKTLYTPHGFSFLCSPSAIKRFVFKTIERMTRFGSYMLACGEGEQSLGELEIGYKGNKSLCWHNCV